MVDALPSGSAYYIGKYTGFGNPACTMGLQRH